MTPDRTRCARVLSRAQLGLGAPQVQVEAQVGRGLPNFNIVGLPESVHLLRRDIEGNFRAVLRSSLSKLDLTTRDEFDVQSRVLERTRAAVTALEQRIVTLEQRIAELESSPPASHTSR